MTPPDGSTPPLLTHEQAVEVIVSQKLGGRLISAVTQRGGFRALSG